MPLPDHLRILMSSSKKDWETPSELFDPINELFDFNLDVCATAENTKVEKYISPEEDAFVVPWHHELGGDRTPRMVRRAMAWMNPEYGKPENACQQPWENCTKKKCKDRGFHINSYIPGIGDWVSRAYEQADLSRATVVCLLPSRTDSEWFQTVWSHAKLICFVRGRVKFIGADSAAPFPSVIAVFSDKELDDDKYEGMSFLGNVIDPREGQILVYQGE